MRRVRIVGRIILDLAAVAGVLFALPWLSVAAGLALFALWGAWEIVLVGFLMDLVWLPSVSAHALPLFTLGAVALVWLVLPLRARFFLPRAASGSMR